VDSLLLLGGRTAFKQISIRLEIGERTMCNISHGKNPGELVETTMLHLREDVEARWSTYDPEFMGGKIFEPTNYRHIIPVSLFRKESRMSSIILEEKATIILCDEAPMRHRHCFEGVESIQCSVYSDMLTTSYLDLFMCKYCYGNLLESILFGHFYWNTNSQNIAVNAGQGHVQVLSQNNL
jgi:hypothetical protein